MSLRTYLVAAVLLALAFAAPAQASRVSMFTQQGQLYLRYYGSPGEANHLTISSYVAGNDFCAGGKDDGFSHKACYLITDPAAAGHVNAGGYCASEDIAYPGQVECDYGVPTGRADDSGMHITIYLDDRNDSVALQTAAATATISGGSGDDTIVTGGAARLQVDGGAGNDTLAAAHAGDHVYGGAGDDTLFEPSDCSLAPTYGGPGTDTVKVSPSCYSGVRLDLRGTDRLYGIENAVGGGGPDRIAGTAGANDLEGGGGGDTIGGLGGDDTLSGGPGNDVLSGGDGNDVIDGGDGDKDRLYGNAGADTLTDGFGSLYGGPGEDKLTAGMTWTGFGPGNVLPGGPGDDVLRCLHVVCRAADGAGNDVVVGSNDLTGDTIFAGPGTDTYDGGGGASAGGGILAGACGTWTCFGNVAPDVISYRLAKRGVDVTLDDHADDGTPGEHDYVKRFGAVVGSRLADRLTAGGAPATLIGGPGRDTLTGGPRGDTLDGGPGDDVLDGGGGEDHLACGLGHDRVTGARARMDEAGCGS